MMDIRTLLLVIQMAHFFSTTGLILNNTVQFRCSCWAWGLWENNVPFRCICSECCTQDPVWRAEFVQMNKAYEYSSSLIHTFCHLEHHEIAFRQRRDKRDAESRRERNERMGPQKPQGRQRDSVHWTEPHEEGPCLVTTSMVIPQDPELLPLGCNFYWGQLQCQHYPAVAKNHVHVE